MPSLNTISNLSRARTLEYISFADGFDLALEDLSEIMKKRFEGWVIHLGSCNTLKTNDKTLQNFVEKTGVSLITGFTKDVDWAETSA